MASPESIVSNTKSQAFPEGAQLTLENFETYGGGDKSDMPFSDKFCSSSPDAQKSLQESYRSGLPKSKAAVEGVLGR